MKQVKIAELKDHLSEHLRAVERGASIEVTDRDRPIAHIVPVPLPDEPIEVRPPKRPFVEIRDRDYPAARWAIDSTTLLREERRDR